MASISVESELMKNQKMAKAMNVPKHFDVLQTKEGDNLIFSIRDDKFIMNREVSNSQTGYVEMDMYPGDAIFKTKSFTVSQNPFTLEIDIVLVVIESDIESESLWVSWKHPNTRAAWGMPLNNWSRLSFTDNRRIFVESVFLQTTQQPQQGSLPVRNFYADIKTLNPSSSERYYIETTNSEPSAAQWVKQNPFNPRYPNVISSCPGHTAQDQGGNLGMYTLLEDNNGAQALALAHVFGGFQKFTFDTKITAISSTPRGDGYTNLFAAGSGGLFFLPADEQDKEAKLTCVIRTAPDQDLGTFDSARELVSSMSQDRTVVWGLDLKGHLVYTTCPVGSEKISEKWSEPMTLASNVKRFSVHLHKSGLNHVILIETQEGQFFQLSQAPVTGKWTETSILLPVDGVADPIETYTFTSHAEVFDSTGQLSPKALVTVESKVGVSMHINDAYYKLLPNEPINVTADATGAITLIQETKSVSAFCYQLSVGGSQPILVDPSSNAMQRLYNFTKTCGDLGKVQIQSGDSSKPLVPTSVSKEDKAKVVEHIERLLTVKRSLPPDGSIASTASSEGTEDDELPTQYFSLGDLLHDIGDIGQVIAHPMEDLYHYIKHGAKVVEDFAIHMAGNVYHFVLKIGGKIYKSILNCVSAVVSAIELVFHKIQVYFEDIVAWLGFVFNWGDILRTHSVMKNVFKLFCRHCFDEALSFKTTIKESVGSLEEKIHEFVGAQVNAPTLDKTAKLAGSSSPQSHWALHHIKSGVSRSENAQRSPVKVSGNTKKLLDDLANSVKDECHTLSTAVQRFQDLAKNIGSEDPGQLIAKVVEILADAALESAKDVALTLIDIVVDLGDAMLSLLDLPLNIPVVSWLYKKVTGADLTVLDLMCLVGAIPITIIYKIATGKAPFPNDEQTTALIKAEKLQDIFGLSANQPTYYSSTANWDVLSTLNFAFNISAGFGAYLTLITSTIEREGGSSLPIGTLKCCSLGAWILFMSPNIPSFNPNDTDWVTVVNRSVTSIGFLKCILEKCDLFEGLDNFSAGFDTLLGVVWLVPGIGGAIENKPSKMSDWFSLVYSIANDVSGVLAIGTIKLNETWEAFVLAINGVVILSGSFAIMASTVYATGN